MNATQERIISYLSNKAIAAGSMSKPIFDPYDMDAVSKHINGSLEDIKKGLLTNLRQ